MMARIFRGGGALAIAAVQTLIIGAMLALPVTASQAPLFNPTSGSLPGVIMAGRRSTSAFHTLRASSYPAAPGRSNCPSSAELILSGVMMLEHLGWQEAADMINKALEKTIDQKVVTYDFARLMEGAKEVKCSEFATAMIGNMA